MSETLVEYLARTRPGTLAVAEDPVAANSKEGGSWANDEKAAPVAKPEPPSNDMTPVFEDNWANFHVAPSAPQAVASSNSNVDQASMVPAQGKWAAFDFHQDKLDAALTGQKSDPPVVAEQTLSMEQPKNPFDDEDEATLMEYAQAKPIIDPFSALMAPALNVQTVPRKAFDPFASLVKK